MDRNKLNITKLQDYLYKLFCGEDKLSKYVFNTNYPTANPSDSYVVIMIRPVMDMNGFGRCTALIHLVSTDKQIGISNSAIIGKMETKLNEIVDKEYVTNNEITLRRRTTYPYHYVPLQAHATIVELTMIIR